MIQLSNRDGLITGRDAEVVEGVRAELDAGADLAELRRLLEDDGGEPFWARSSAVARPPIPPPAMTMGGPGRRDVSAAAEAGVGEAGRPALATAADRHEPARLLGETSPACSSDETEVVVKEVAQRGGLHAEEIHSIAVPEVDPRAVLQN